MRFPTISQFNDSISAITKQFEQVDHLQTQILTGKKIQVASEDPALANRIKDVDDHIQSLKSFQLNGTLAANRTNLMLERTQEAINLMGRSQEIIQQAQNDTLNNSDRANLAAELKANLQTMMALANTQDENGDYIFSGMNVKTPAYTQVNDQYTYQGSQAGTLIPLGEHTNVLYNDSGYQRFDTIKLGNGTFSVSSDPVNNTGTGIINVGSITSAASYVPDDYTLTMTTNALGQLAYAVVGTNSGQVIPVPPAILPDDAPAYVAGKTIEFNGVNIQITGQPNLNDVFHVTPSTTDNVFNMMQTAINTLSQPIHSEKEKADMQQVLVEQSSSFKQIFNHFQSNLADIGYRGKRIDEHLAMSKANLVDTEIMSSQLSDADLGSLISNLTQRLTALEVTHQTYLEIQETYRGLLNM